MNVIYGVFAVLNRIFENYGRTGHTEIRSAQDILPSPPSKVRVLDIGFYGFHFLYIIVIVHETQTGLNHIQEQRFLDGGQFASLDAFRRNGNTILSRSQQEVDGPV